MGSSLPVFSPWPPPVPLFPSPRFMVANSSDIWVCPHCRSSVDVSALGIYAKVCCPRCAQEGVVHTQLGHFVLERVLGIGGMSVVYRALDVELNRPLAVKVLNESFRGQPERVERFENECAMMARVRHENVTSVYSAGRAYGQFYIAMELVEGKNLEHMVTARHPLEPKRALSIIRQVAMGLQAAAEAGLLHRDMKPGNILITPEDKAKVIDFGLAVESGEGDTEEIIWATPYYVPPETLQRGPEDERTDIYALGMTLRYMLTGVESFPTPAGTPAELTECKRKLPPIAWLKRWLHPEVCRFVDHMTKFSVADRPKGYAELLEELDRVQMELLEDEQLQLTPPRVKLRRFVLPLLALSVLAGGALALYRLPPRPEPQQARLQLLPAALPKYSAAGLEEALAQLRQKGNEQAAVTALLQLAEEPADPGMGAWAACLAQALLGARCANADAAEQAAALLSRHLAPAAEAQVPEPMKKFYALLVKQAQMQEQLRGKQAWTPPSAAELRAQDIALDATPLPEPLRLVQRFMLAERAYWAGEGALYEQLLEKIRTAPVPEAYAPLAARLGEPADVYARRAAALVDPRARAVGLMRQHRVVEARQLLGMIARDQRYAAKAGVLSEVCMVAQELLEALRRKQPELYSPGMDSSRLGALAGKVGSAVKPARAELRDEARLIGLLLEGDLAEAFRQAHELREKNQLSAPFSVLLSDWQRRLDNLPPEQQ